MSKEQNPDLAYALNGDGSAEEISFEQANSEFGKPVWIHVDFERQQELQALFQRLTLDDLILESLFAESTRPRAVPYREGLLITLRGVNLNAGENPEDMVSVRLWVSEKLMVTVSRKKLLSIDDLEQQFLQKRGAETTAGLMVELVDRLVWRMSDTIEDMEDKVADLEERLMGQEQNLRFELASLRRQSIVVRRYLAPQREALSRLSTEKVSWITEESRIYLREINDRLIRHIEDIEAVRERAAITHEELNSRHSEQLNAKMYILSVITAIFLPLGFLTGLLGINVGGIPGAENPNAFGLFIGLVISIVVLQTIVFRWKKWL